MTLEEEGMIKGTSVRGGDRNSAGQGEQGNSPFLDSAYIVHVYMPINPKLDLNLFIDHTDSDTLEEDKVRGTNVRGRGGQGQSRAARCKEGSDPFINGIVYILHLHV